MQKVALVTGANGAIGAATVQQLREDGYVVVAADLDTPEDATGGPDRLLRLDVRDPEAVQQSVDGLVETFGRIDVLVNVAGVTSTGSAGDLATDEWRRVIDINLSGSFWCCQSVLRYMKKQRSGRIVNLGSVLGKNGGNARPWIAPEEQVGSGNVAYGVSKAGVHAMTAYLAKEAAAFGVTVNAVAPGPIASAMTTKLSPSITAMIPVGMMGRPSDVAAVIGFLVSDRAAFISGEIIDINGAMWCD